MVKITSLLFVVALAAGIAAIAAAQQHIFSQSCAALSFGSSNASGQLKGSQMLFIPCQKVVSQ
jgi:hypothetical protein